MKLDFSGIFGRKQREMALVPKVEPSFADTRPEISAAAQIPTQPAPKVPNKQQVLPSFLRTAKPNPKTALPLDDRRLANTDITTYRTAVSTRETIYNFVKSSPDLSAAVTSYVRVGITKGYTAIARNMDGTVNPEATSYLQSLVTWMDVLNDYTLGYDDSPSIRSLCESWAAELLMFGGMAGELVLNKARLPDKIQPVSIAQVVLYPSSDGTKLVPTQKLSGKEISLDIPTFFMVTLDQNLRNPYAESPLESALQAVLFSAEFMNDIRKIVKKAIHPRVVVTIDEEKFRKTIPQEKLVDTATLTAYMNQVVQSLSDQINGLEPDEAIVVFDSIGIDVVDHGNTNLSNEYEVMQGMADSKLSTGAKTLPTVLGHSDGTSNVASTEAMLFVKYVEGSVWSKLNEMLSKVFTLAVRLGGYDVYVTWLFDAINLKPESELESFYALRQSRVLEQLSLGLITDEEASIILTGKLPPAGMPKLSGTNFMQPVKADPAGDGHNGASNSGSTLNQQQKPTTPTGGARGSNKKKADLELVDVG
jgi:hypothetical protein